MDFLLRKILERLPFGRGGSGREEDEDVFADEVVVIQSSRGEIKEVQIGWQEVRGRRFERLGVLSHMLSPLDDPLHSISSLALRQMSPEIPNDLRGQPV
jgi:transcriptional regulator of aromatic amino acid metabolism